MRSALRSFLEHEAAGGICLILAAAVALVWANSPGAGFYESLWHMNLRLGATVGNRFYGLENDLHFWINDALMALFFFLVGLEIKRECTRGELSTRQRALQPVFAALGGMVVPALIFFVVNRNHPEFLRGWAIPCATDIAFALGVMALLGSRVPVGMKILLTAIAIIDDLIAIIIIALFYSHDPQWMYMWLVLGGMAVLALLNRMGSGRMTLYILAGMVVWTGFLKAGLHPTLAGVVTAMAIPLSTRDHPSPLVTLQHALHPWVVFFILPVFALANAGISFTGVAWASILTPLTLGVTLGLLIGKPLGIMGGIVLGHVTGYAPIPDHYSWKTYAGIALLCGIGFTIALFIGGLAFHKAEVMNEVKLGVLSASLLSAVIGWVVCRLTFPVKD